MSGSEHCPGCTAAVSICPGVSVEAPDVAACAGCGNKTVGHRICPNCLVEYHRTDWRALAVEWLKGHCVMARDGGHPTTCLVMYRNVRCDVCRAASALDRERKAGKGGGE